MNVRRNYNMKKLIIGLYIFLAICYIYMFYNEADKYQYINPKECTETKMNSYFSIFNCGSYSNEVESIKFLHFGDGNCYYHELYSNGSTLSVGSDNITVIDKDRTTVLKGTSEAYGLKVSCDRLYKEIMRNLKI